MASKQHAEKVGQEARPQGYQSNPNDGHALIHKLSKTLVALYCPAD